MTVLQTEIVRELMGSCNKFVIEQKMVRKISISVIKNKFLKKKTFRENLGKIKKLKQQKLFKN